MKKIQFFNKSKLTSNKNIMLINLNFLIKKDNLEVWSTFKQILADEPSEQCLGAYVISMTTSVSDILSVSFITITEAKIKNKLRVVPLI